MGVRARAARTVAVAAAVVAIAGVVMSGIGTAEEPEPAGEGGPVVGVPVEGTPCTSTARACVDLDKDLAWLFGERGEVLRGPVRVMQGDEANPTPLGTFTVQWKAQEYTSRESLVQMPYSVFFADGGVAFHEGRQDTYSKGCVKLTHDDAVAWFNYLQVGDEVQVM
ncbi:L,D-transpeptidase [Pseudonocardia sp. TRM90224]|uniref:L,D-transpeptidase n=1 Tax=Pseudonocardia sp. TRM90224 TaxID=2812678 RepID=UPI001E362EF1|nr:L,D-transpeptidase [Pseudonocardia sp. TRM90224]